MQRLPRSSLMPIQADGFPIVGSSDLVRSDFGLLSRVDENRSRLWMIKRTAERHSRFAPRLSTVSAKAVKEKTSHSFCLLGFFCDSEGHALKYPADSRVAVI